MADKNFIKNITSKNINLSKNTISNMIKTASVDCFEELCQKSDFIFPFLKERISNDFVKLISKDDLKTVFEFSKIYCPDFEELIVKSFLKFASEDLTDEILDKLDNGTNEQKAYCVLYFKYIQDSLAVEYLEKLSYSDFEPLKVNCAQVLSIFKYDKICQDMKNIILNSDDDFEKNSAYLFLSAYQGEDNIQFILDNFYKSPFRVQIIANLLNYNDFEFLKKFNQDKIIQIFYNLLEGYPEDIDLSTIEYYKILDFIKLIASYNNQLSKNILILANEKFKEFYENDVYSFDLDKNTKLYLSEICKYLKSLDLSLDGLKEELTKVNTINYEIALDVINSLKLKDFAQILADNLFFINDTDIAKTVLILKQMGLNNLISSEIIEKIQNENVKLVVQSNLN